MKKAAGKLKIEKDVLLLAQACRYEKAHAVQVAGLSLELFNQLSPLHKLGAGERKSLERAAILHDIGWIQGQRGHHKVSRDIIISSALLKLTKKEKVVIALIARYHRGSLPKKSHKYYSQLTAGEKEMIEKLSAILRLADGLDWRHGSLVKRLKCGFDKSKIIISLDAVNFAEKDMVKAREKVDLCERVFRKKVLIRLNAR